MLGYLVVSVESRVTTALVETNQNTVVKTMYFLPLMCDYEIDESIYRFLMSDRKPLNQVQLLWQAISCLEEAFPKKNLQKLIGMH